MPIVPFVALVLALNLALAKVSMNNFYLEPGAVVELKKIFAERQKLSQEIDTVQGGKEAFVFSELTSLAEQERALYERISVEKPGCFIVSNLGTSINPESIWLFEKSSQDYLLVSYNLDSQEVQVNEIPNNPELLKRIQVAILSGENFNDIFLSLDSVIGRG